MAELDPQLIARRSIHGVIVLSSRYFVIQLIGLVASIILQYNLDPSALGVYAIVSSFIAFLVYFSDIGLAAALIQKKEEITDDDLKTTFTIQQLLVVTVTIIAMAVTGIVSSVYHLDKPGILLYQVLVFSFFLASLKTIPSILLERKLDFNSLVIPQILENLVFNIVVIILVLMHFGVTSYTWGVLARGIVGLVAIYIIKPWLPKIGISLSSAKKLISFGFPFQTNSILALLKDKLLILVLGIVFTRGEIGFIYGFAQVWAYKPLQFAMDSIVRITFPTFSRLQNNISTLTRAVEKTLFLILTIICPLLVGLAIIGPYIIHIIPKFHAKYEPAIISLVFFSAEAILSGISTPLTNFLNAIGKIRITLNLMVFWTIAIWATTFICASIFGFNGVAIASFIVSLSVFLVIYITKRYIPFKIKTSILPPLAASFVMGISVSIVAQIFVKDALTIIITILFGGIIYSAILFAIAKNQVIADIQTVKHYLKKA